MQIDCVTDIIVTGYCPCRRRHETLFVFLLLLVTIILFASDRLRLDVVAVLVILALMLSGLLSPGEALAGFGDPVVVLIAGIAYMVFLGRKLLPKETGETRESVKNRLSMQGWLGAGGDRLSCWLYLCFFHSNEP